jgi:hypothetical protein
VRCAQLLQHLVQGAACVAALLRAHDGWHEAQVHQRIVQEAPTLLALAHEVDHAS